LKKENLERHVPDCSVNGVQKVKLVDEKDRWVKFKAIQRMLPVPFVIYADLESYTSKLEGPTLEKDQSGSETYELHEPSGYCYHIVSSDPKLNELYSPKWYRGENVIDKLLEDLRQESTNICKILQNVKAMDLTPQEQRQYHKAKRCYLCNKLLGADRVSVVSKFSIILFIYYSNY
jgi:hypothetical protein